MSLDFELGKIKDFEEVCFTEIDGEKRIKGRTQSLIWLTMAVGIGNITANDAGEFYSRVHAWEKCMGVMSGDGKEMTLDEVKAHVGLKTNVFPKLTTAQFAKKLARAVLDHNRVDYRFIKAIK